jgi:ABC-type Co2+ transport system permease subunit
MHELFPIAAGVLVGLLTFRIAQPRWRAAALVVMSVVFGFAASAISGELALSWGFLLIDIPLVFLAATATVLAVNWVRRTRAVSR